MGILLSMVPWWGRWVAIGLLCVALVGFGWVKRGENDQGRYEALQAQFEAFKEKVAGEGIAAKERSAAVQKYQKEVSDETVKGLKQDLADVAARYDSALADLGRVRVQSDTRGRYLSDLAKSSLGSCPAEAEQLSGRLASVEGEVLNLLQQADSEHVKYVRLWEWADAQSEVK